MSEIKYACNSCKDTVPVARKAGSILVHAAREHNLKNICFEIPKNKLVALTGPSGSGKSSIATNVLQNECIRQYLESLGMTTDHIEKAKVDSISGLSPSIGVGQRVADFNPRSTVGTRTGILTIIRNMFATLGHQSCTGCAKPVKQPLHNKHKETTLEVEVETKDSSFKKTKKSFFECPHCNQQLEKLTMAHFSLNTLRGACTSCKGLGETIVVDYARLVHPEKTVQNGGVDCWDEGLANYYTGALLAASKHYNFPFDPTIPLKNYTPEQTNFLLYGITSPQFVKTYKHIKAPKKVSEGNFEGIIPPLLALYKKNPLKAPEAVKKYIVQGPCIECNNTALEKIGRETTVSQKTITHVANLSLTALLAWLRELATVVPADEQHILEAFSGALQERLSNLEEVGLGYLSLDRTLPSLSVGESQRLKLANLLGSGLTGVLYVLDEPTTGLHPHDTAKLLKTVRKIQEAGNTVLIIEHDVDVIKSADYIIDIGPGAGSNGGQVVVSGTPAEVMTCSQSITGTYLKRKISSMPKRLAYKNEALVVRNAHEHNLQGIDVYIPINQFVVLTGVSGSGKSTLLFEIIDKVARNYFNQASEIPGKHTSVEGLEHFKRLVTVDQATLGNSKSSRSNVATYTKLFDRIRDLFAALPEAKSRGFDAEKFSFNTSPERCENCNGAGVVDVDMAFMPDIEKECPVCNGMRFNDALLAVQFQGNHIADVLDMTVSQAHTLFNHDKKITALLTVMKEVGLEYLKLGQSTSTLSGGEAQRIKLAAELSKPETGKTLYLLDEPTTGLHPHEVQKLLGILRKLVSKGNTVVTIEHNLDAMCEADTIIDFGPGGGVAGGNIVATGTPEDIAECSSSVTGKALKAYISGD